MPSCLSFNTFNGVTYTAVQSDASNVAGSFQGNLDMMTGADGKVTGMVQLVAAANANFFFGSRTASAFVDPHLEIDAAFLAANPGATLTITPGVGNEIGFTAVPESSTYALILAGLGIVGVAACRRRGSKSKSLAC